MKNSSKKDIGFVLLHGAGLGSWIWEDLISNTDFPCLAIDLPGRGKHADKANMNYSLNQYIDSALNDIESFNHKHLVIVAHSISGVIGLELADRLKDRSIGFIAVSAAIPRANGSYINCFPLIMRLFLKLMFKFSGTRPPDSVIQGGLCNDLDDKITSKVIERFTPESIKLYTDNIQTNNFPDKSLYVHLLQDKALNDSIQKRMIANLNAKQVIDIDSGHLPMLGKPEELANAFNSFAKAL